MTQENEPKKAGQQPGQEEPLNTGGREQERGQEQTQTQTQDQAEGEAQTQAQSEAQPEAQSEVQSKAQAPAPAASRLFTPEGKPVRVLSTSLGIALLANAIFIPGAAYSADSTTTSADEPKLVSWSTEEVKQYFDKNVDWSIPLPASEGSTDAAQPSGSPEPSATPEPGSGGGTTIVNNYGSTGSGFGWDDLLLYHLLFNSGSGYSTSGWYGNHRGYYTGTSTQYKPRSYTSGSFQNKSTAGSVAKPKTSTTTTGSITRRSTSSSPGSIGGKSSGLSSSGSSSGTSSSSKSSSGSITRSSGSSSSSSSGKSSGGLFGG